MRVALLKETHDVVIDPRLIDDSVLAIVSNIEPEKVEQFAQDLASASDKAEFLIQCGKSVWFNDGKPPYIWTMADVKANKEKRLK